MCHSVNRIVFIFGPLVQHPVHEVTNTQLSPMGKIYVKDITTLFLVPWCSTLYMKFRYSTITYGKDMCKGHSYLIFGPLVQHPVHEVTNTQLSPMGKIFYIDIASLFLDP